MYNTLRIQQRQDQATFIAASETDDDSDDVTSTYDDVRSRDVDCRVVDVLNVTFIDSVFCCPSPDVMS